MSFQLTFLGYYSIKSPQLKKQTHSVKRRNWSHRERTAQADGPRWTAEADGFRWTAIADGPRRTGQPSASVGRPWRTAPAAGGRPPRRTSVGSSDASGRPPDAAVDVRTRDNPDSGPSALAVRRVPSADRLLSPRCRVSTSPPNGYSNAETARGISSQTSCLSQHF
jgi:hypothetical protein